MLLSDRIKQFPLVCQAEIFSELALKMVHMEDFLPSRSRGRPLAHRTTIGRALFARMIFQILTTTALRERLMADRMLRSLCGWSHRGDVPSASAFSRVFQEFAGSELPIRIQEALITSCYGKEIVGPISRDSTAIEARKAAGKKEEKEDGPKGSPMLERQREISGANEIVNALPKECTVGCEQNAREVAAVLDVAEGAFRSVVSEPPLPCTIVKSPFPWPR